MKEKLIAMLKAAGVDKPEAVAKAMMADTENGKLLIDDGDKNTYIPKSRLDSEIEKKKKVQENLDSANSTIEGLEKQVGENADAVKNINEYKAKAEKAESELLAFNENQVIMETINSFEKKPHDAEAVLALIDRSKLVVKDGKALGLEDQLKDLGENKAFLFQPDDAEEGGKGTGKIGNPGAGGGIGNKGGGKDEEKEKDESIGAQIGKTLVEVSTGPKESFFS